MEDLRKQRTQDDQISELIAIGKQFGEYRRIAANEIDSLKREMQDLIIVLEHTSQINNMIRIAVCETLRQEEEVLGRDGEYKHNETYIIPRNLRSEIEDFQDQHSRHPILARVSDPKPYADSETNVAYINEQQLKLVKEMAENPEDYPNDKFHKKLHLILGPVYNQVKFPFAFRVVSASEETQGPLAGSEDSDSGDDSLSAPGDPDWSVEEEPETPRPQWRSNLDAPIKQFRSENGFEEMAVKRIAEKHDIRIEYDYVQAIRGLGNGFGPCYWKFQTDTPLDYPELVRDLSELGIKPANIIGTQTTQLIRRGFIIPPGE